MGIANGLGVEYEIQELLRFFGLSNWKNESVIYWYRLSEMSKFREEIKVILGHVKFEVSI